jgi:hypothetical protein
MKFVLPGRRSNRVCLLATSVALALWGAACGAAGGAGSPDGGDGPPSDPARYGFETDVQGWTSSGDMPVTNIGLSSVQKAAGAKSLVGTIAATTGSMAPYVMEIVFSDTLGAISPGSTATFHVYIPTGAAVYASQPYLNESDAAPMPFRFTGTWTEPTPGVWQTIDVKAPADVTGLLKVGVQFFVNAAWTGQVYVDSVDFH